MPKSTGFILGFDPGGIGRFGWSVCDATPEALARLQTGLADDAVGALHEVEKAMESCGLRGNPTVLAAGIDAPMFWGAKGNREIDAVLRSALRDTQFPTPGGTVQQVNSLRGACLAQGVLLGKYLHEKWDLPITETHPKALLHLLSLPGQFDIGVRVTDLTTGLDEHERDATLSAVAAWAMIRDLPGWCDLYAQEPNPIQPFDTPVGFWMPLSQTSVTMPD